MNQTSLLLIDGSYYMFRAYFGVPSLHDQQGRPVNAIFGFLKMLRKLLAEIKPQYVACVFDAKEPSFRSDLLPQYKAQRASMPNELREQIAPIHQLIRLMGVKTFAVPGVEADDVLGTLAVRHSHDQSVLIATNDKDMNQVVRENISILDGKNNILDPDQVLIKFGVRPDQIVDYLMLLGDAADNVPGVDKVGPKTAVKLLNEYNNISNILANASQIKGVVGQNLSQAQEKLELNRQLIELKLDCDLTEHVKDLQDLRLSPMNEDKWRDFLVDHSLSRSLSQVPHDIALNELLRQHTQDHTTKPNQASSCPATTEITPNPKMIQNEFNF